MEHSTCKYTYVLVYNAGGGTGVMEPTVAVKNKKFTLSANTFVKKSYVFSCWTVQRKSDGKMVRVSKGWQSDRMIKLFKYKKKVYNNKASMSFNTSWYKGAKKKCYLYLLRSMEGLLS